MKNKLCFIGLLFVCLFSGVNACAAPKKQSAIQAGTQVRTRADLKGVFDQDCYDKYYSCMDLFCISDNESGGSCNCSDDIFKYDSALDDIRRMLSDAERISMEEVEKAKAGANADIIFKGYREYDKDGNVIETRASKTKDQKNIWSAFYDIDNYDQSNDNLANLRGAELYDSVHEICVQQIASECSKDIDLLTQTYARQIVSDCKGLANSIEQKRAEAKNQLFAANASVRAALRESFQSSNKYDRGTCMIEYKKCMQGADVCGEDWEQCVFEIASERMQNKQLKPGNPSKKTGKKTSNKTNYDITPSTLERLESKRFVCERVLDNCVAVRNYVWDDFLRDVAPVIRLAESNIESKKRQSCLKDISDCINKSCKDDIVTKGVATMDACLARPSIARSNCLPQIEPCESMDPNIWKYVESKLAAMRVDACTQEVKDCFTAENACGPDLANCIGMDYDNILKMCDAKKLIVCAQDDEDFSIDKIDNLLMGLYLNIDNKSLENCQKIAEQKMVELCGSVSDCDMLVVDDILGTGSIRSQKDGAIYRVTGMISFGSIKIGAGREGVGDTQVVKDSGKTLQPGELGVADYIKQVKLTNDENVGHNKEIISNITEELNNIAGTINRAILTLESDIKIQWCINGRDLSQVKGTPRGSEVTAARYPHLLDQYRTTIALSALRKAQSNYNKKVMKEIEDASKNYSADIAQYLCQKMADIGKNSTNGKSIKEYTPLTPPYAISYEVGAGLDNETLISVPTSGTDQDRAWDEDNNISGSKTTRTATFNRETRKCHVCTTVTTKSCKQSGQLGQKKNRSCVADTPDPFCEDIKM